MKSPLPRSKQLQPVTGCWEAIEATQIWRGSPESVGAKEPLSFFDTAVGGGEDGVAKWALVPRSAASPAPHGAECSAPGKRHR